MTGDTPDLGAWRAAEVLTGQLGIPVTSDAVAELARRGFLPVTGNYKGYPLYDGRALATFTDAGAAAEAIFAGQLRTADDACTCSCKGANHGRMFEVTRTIK